MSQRVRERVIRAGEKALEPPQEPAELAITELATYPVREPVSGRSYTILRLKTRSGLLGFGECGPLLKDDVLAAKQFWVGRAATSYANSLDSSLAGGIDMALLDIVGKACRAPVYRVLGGPTRNKARALATVDGITAIERALSAGYRCFSVPVPSPVERNQGQAYQLHTRKLFEAVHAAGGDFVVDGKGLLTAADAASVATTIQSLHPLWFDEPCKIMNLQTIRKISDESVVPLGFGRSVQSSSDFQDLLRDGLIDIVRPDLILFGITRTRRIAALAETYYTAVAPNHDGGPIATAAALHLAASLPNFFIQHIPSPAAVEDRAMRAELMNGNVEQVKDGFASLTVEPGLGITVNESALEKYRAA